MRLVGHSDDVGLVGPANGNKNRTEDLLACQPPVVGRIGEDRGEGEISLRQGAGRRRQTAQQKLLILALILDSIFDVAANLVELLLVDDRPDIGCLVERIANFEFRRLGRQRCEEIVENVGMQKKA